VFFVNRHTAEWIKSTSGKIQDGRQAQYWVVFFTIISTVMTLNFGWAQVVVNRKLSKCCRYHNSNSPLASMSRLKRVAGLSGLQWLLPRSTSVRPEIQFRSRSHVAFSRVSSQPRPDAGQRMRRGTCAHCPASESTSRYSTSRGRSPTTCTTSRLPLTSRRRKQGWER